MLQIARFGATAICDSNRESQITTQRTPPGVVPGRLLAAPPDNSPPAISMSGLCQVSFAVLSVSVCFCVMPFFQDGVGCVFES